MLEAVAAAGSYPRLEEAAGRIVAPDGPMSAEGTGAGDIYIGRGGIRVCVCVCESERERERMCVLETKLHPSPGGRGRRGEGSP